MQAHHLLSLALRRGAQQAGVFALETVETPACFQVNRLKEIARQRPAGV